MSKFSNEKIDKHIRSAVSQITPNQADKIWEKSVELADDSAWYLDGTAAKKHSGHRVLKTITASAVCFLICMLSFVALYMQADAAIYLDVNPSVGLQINRFDRVVSAQARNADGEAILKDMDLKHTDVDVALNAILGSMVKHGYLTETSGTVLVSVECSNQKRADALKLEVSSQVEEEVDALIHSGTVFAQEIESDEVLENLAEEYSMTEGKAALLQKLVSKYPNLDYESLANLSMNELLAMLAQENIDIDDYLGDDLIDTDLPDNYTHPQNDASSKYDDPDDDDDLDKDDDMDEDDIWDKDDDPDDDNDLDDCDISDDDD